jgi:hypothetical protein
MAKAEAVLDTPVQKMDTPAVDPNASFSITAAQLMELFKSMTQGSNETLAHAILEARKPYIDPRKEIDEENARIQAREQMRRQKEDQKYSQSVCPHVAGSNALSELPDTAGRTSIVWHRFDVGDELGICTNCTRIFTPTDTDYAQWRMKKSYNRMSRSGDRQFRDPIAAQKAARQ